MKENQEKQNTIVPMFKEITNIPLLNKAKTLAPWGELMHHATTTYCYLKIDDDFIYSLFPLLNAANICVPAYFEPSNKIGAHISVVYPNEYQAQTLIDDLKLGKFNRKVSFEVTRLVSVELMHKTIFALIISSATLKGIRAQYGLGDKLNYKGYLVPFHITLAVKSQVVIESEKGSSNMA